MTDEKLILSKIEKVEQKVDKIESAISQLAVQNEKITHLSAQISALWEKYDQAFGPGGVVTQVKNFQAACPGEAVKDGQQRLWFALGVVATMMAGGVLKAFGAF